MSISKYSLQESLNLGQVPELENQELYNELMSIHDAIETLASLVSREYAYKTITFADSPYDIQLTDKFITLDTTGGAIELNFPPIVAALGYEYVFRHIDGIAVATLNGNGSDLIDGSATFGIIEMGRVAIKNDSIEWRAISSV